MTDPRSALAEISRLRLATSEGSLRERADRMWEIAEAALASPPVATATVDECPNPCIDCALDTFGHVRKRATPTPPAGGQ